MCWMHNLYKLCYLTTSITTMMTIIINHTELAWCHPMNFVLGMDLITSVTYGCQSRRQVIRCMSNLECNLLRRQLSVQTMKIMQLKFLFISC